MDGPTIKWTVADLFLARPRVALTYHVSTSGWSYMVPVWMTLGGLLNVATPVRARFFPTLTSLQFVGNSGLIGGVFGACAGAGLMYAMSKKEDIAIPFTDEGIQQRVDGLHYNFKVRTLDLGTWTGIGAASVMLLAVGGQTKLGLASSVMGVAQGLAYGSAIGSMASIAYLTYKLREDRMDDDDEDD